jgi:hypothetical protein
MMAQPQDAGSDFTVWITHGGKCRWKAAWQKGKCEGYKLKNSGKQHAKLP